MTALTVRLPDEKHRRLKALAKSRGTPLNRLIDEMRTLMLAEFDAETRFQLCAARGTGQEAQAACGLVDDSGAGFRGDIRHSSATTSCRPLLGCLMTSAVTGIDVPPSSRISRELQGADFFDSYEMPFAHDGRSALEIYLKIVAKTPSWINFLMATRNRIVAVLGLKNLGHLGDLNQAKVPAAYRVGDRVGIFSLLSISDDEIILGDSDTHLDVKVSVCKLAQNGRQSVAVTTVVHIHNLLGRIYMLFVAPVHRLIVPASLARAAVVRPDE